MPLPFTLVRTASRWTAWWAERRIRVVVAGSDREPDPARVAILERMITRWPDVVDAIATFARTLAPDRLIRLETASRGWEGFAASSCGFDGELRFESIVLAPDPERPDPGRHVITFYTGEPDGYATFTAHFEGDHVVDLTAFAS